MAKLSASAASGASSPSTTMPRVSGSFRSIAAQAFSQAARLFSVRASTSRGARQGDRSARSHPPSCFSSTGPTLDGITSSRNSSPAARAAVARRRTVAPGLSKAPHRPEDGRSTAPSRHARAAIRQDRCRNPDRSRDAAAANRALRPVGRSRARFRRRHEGPPARACHRKGCRNRSARPDTSSAAARQSRLNAPIFFRDAPAASAISSICRDDRRRRRAFRAVAQPFVARWTCSSSTSCRSAGVTMPRRKKN